MTYAWFGFRFSPPEMWIRQGLTLATKRPSLRNQRPVRRRHGSTSNNLIVPRSGTQSTMRAVVAAQIQADRSRRIILNASALLLLRRNPGQRDIRLADFLRVHHGNRGHVDNVVDFA